MTQNLWKWIYVCSLIAAMVVMWPTLSRPADGDDSAYFYTSGLMSWSQALSDVFLFPDKRVYFFNRWRPFFLELWPKILWSFNLSPVAYKIFNWIFNWFGILVFSLGIHRLLSLALPLRKEMPWALAALFWLSPPLMLTITSPINILLGSLLFGSSLLLMLDSGKGWHRWLRFGSAFFLSFLTCQSSESYWPLFVMASAWIGLLNYLKITRPQDPRFWWPLTPLVFYLLFYRSFSASDYQGAIQYGPGMSLTLETFSTNISYYGLVLFNSMVEPLPGLLGASRHPLDITPAPHAMTLILTAIALTLGIWKIRNLKPAKKPKVSWRLISTLLLISAIGVSVPYWFVHHRLIHYMIWPCVFFYIWFVTALSRGKEFHTAPVLLLVLSNFLASHFIVSNWNWIEMNAGYAKQFTQWALNRPGMQDCSSSRPCCIKYKDRVGGRTEWELNWNVGAPHQPVFYPDNWPDAPCVKTVSLD